MDFDLEVYVMFFENTSIIFTTAITCIARSYITCIARSYISQEYPHSNTKTQTPTGSRRETRRELQQHSSLRVSTLQERAHGDPTFQLEKSDFDQQEKTHERAVLYRSRGEEFSTEEEQEIDVRPG